MPEALPNRSRSGYEGSKKEETMAKVTLYPMIKRISGKMGNVAFRLSPQMI
jgi:hypothetical protein